MHRKSNFRVELCESDTDGVDIKAEPGEALFSIRSGKVVALRNTFQPNQYGNKSYGNYITIETILPNGDKLQLRYNHLRSINVSNGDQILPGQQIGLAGKTGNAADKANGNKRIGYYHTHIRARLNGKKVDPEDYMGVQFDNNGQIIQNSNNQN